MKKSFFILVAIGMVFANNLTKAWDPDVNDQLELSVAQAIIKANVKDSSLTKWFDTAYAYAVYPKVGKGGFVIGGAYGKGLVINGDTTVGETSISQLTVGAQLGGQVYAQYIMFRDKTAFEHFTHGNFEFGAQVSAVAVTMGASVDANYDGGVAVFTLAEGGLMAEASIGGQKFKYKAK